MKTLLSLPFDQYQRYRIVSDIINKFRAGERKFKILDAGAGFEENLKKFLPLDDIYCLDKDYPPEYSHKEFFIAGDILMMEFKEKYDFVVAVDIYEHISHTDRKKFIDIIIPLSEIATIIAAPFDQDEVRKCELLANKIYKTVHGSDYIWLKEHLENGLPSLPNTLDLIKEHRLNSVTIPNGYLPRWFEMISTYLLIVDKPEFQPIMTMLFEFYNQSYYSYDNQNPAYRQIIIIPQEDWKIDFSDLTARAADPEELCNKNFLLESFIEKIKRSYQISDNAHKQEIITINQLLVERTAHVLALEQITAAKDSQLDQISAQVQSLGQVLVERDQQLREMTTQIQSLKFENNSIKHSMTYQLNTKFHSRIIERYFPHNTRRRKYHDLFLKGGRILVNEGWNSFWRHFRERISHKQSPSWKKIIPPVKNTFAIQQLEDIKIIDTCISIIIPTKNAGSDFENVLEKIKNQKGIKTIEIIVIDSGSTDNTLRIAENFGARIFQINPADFNHGLTRNYGAEKGTGEFVVFIVQDAIPVGDFWLFNVLKTFENDEEIAAVTCRQVPRSDADIFACYSMWYHYAAMEFQENKIVQINSDEFKILSFFEKRKLAGIDDVCSCFKKKIFDKFKFEKFNFAEDLNLGIRLLENGYKLAFLHSAGVIHSHNRDAEYFIRRYYVDSKSLVEMFNLVPDMKEKKPDLAIKSINSLYHKLKLSLAIINAKYPNDINVDIFFSELKQNFDSNEFVMSNSIDDNKLERLISDLNALSTSISIDTKLLNTDFFSLLDNFRIYVRISCDSYNTLELVESTYKLFATYSGSYLGNLYYYNSTNKTMQSIDKILKEGV